MKEIDELVVIQTRLDLMNDAQTSFRWPLAHYLEMTGRSLEARELYQKAIEIDPSDLEANWRFANYLKDTGEHEEAKFYLRRLLELDPNYERAASILLALSDKDV